MPPRSARQKRFMCAEYGRAKRGQATRSGISRSDARDFCVSKVKSSKRSNRKSRGRR